MTFKDLEGAITLDTEEFEPSGGVIELPPGAVVDAHSLGKALREGDDSLLEVIDDGE